MSNAIVGDYFGNLQTQGRNYVLLTQDFVRDDLSNDLASVPDFVKKFKMAAPAIFLNGSAVHAGSKARASGINILSADERFFNLYSGSEQSTLSEALSKKPGQIFPSVVINTALQEELNASVGEQVLLSFEKPGDIARASLLGHKDTEDVITTLRLQVTKIIPSEGIARFGLRPHQALPLNALFW